MEKQKKSYGKTALIILLLIVTIASLVLATYAWAKYTSSTSSTATAQVAKWDVGVTFANKDFEETFTHILEGRMAPGAAGSFDITINPKSTEVDFKYEIILEEVTGNVPKHLHFYTANSHNPDCEIDIGCVPDEQEQENAQSYLTGTITGSTDGAASQVTKTIYWEWPYENPNKGIPMTDTQKINDAGNALENGTNNIDDYDDQDTLDGMTAGNVTVKFKVIATQLSPNE